MAFTVSTTDSRGISHSLMSWKAVFAGTLVALLVYAILFALGIGIGGLSLQNVFQGADGKGLGIGTGIFVVLINIIALFAGGYFAARISNFHTPRIGSAQGLVIASIFFGIMFIETLSVAGWATNKVGSAVSQVGSVAADAVGQPEVMNQIKSAIGDRTLKSDVDTVAQGVSARLLRGDNEGAKAYLADQAGMSVEEADQKIASLQTQVKGQLQEAGKAGAQVVAGIGWSLFFILLLGTIMSCVGGMVGARANHHHPLDEREVTLLGDRRTA
jgi:hypothetical protein